MRSASAPFAPSPTMSKPGSVSSRCFRPSRKIGWSSTIAMRMGGAALLSGNDIGSGLLADRNRELDMGAGGVRLDREPPAERLGSLAERSRSDATGGEGAMIQPALERKATAVIVDG